MKPTPAQALAKKKQRQRKPRNRTKPGGPLRCRCREIRESLGLTLFDVADAIGMSKAGLHAVEHGNDLQMTTAIKLSKFCGVSIDSLWRDAND